MSEFHNALDLPFGANASVGRTSRPMAVEGRVLILFDECGPALRRYIGSFNVNAATREDIVQDVFLALFRHLTLGRPDSNLKGWLFQVAHNLALKHRRRLVKRSRVESAWDTTNAERVVDGALNPEERLARQQRQRRLVDVLERMPERDRRCVYLRAEGLCYREIAKTLGMSLGSVAKSVVRAVARLTAIDTE